MADWEAASDAFQYFQRTMLFIVSGLERSASVSTILLCLTEFQGIIDAARTEGYDETTITTLVGTVKFKYQTKD